MYSEDIKEESLWLMKGDSLERMKEIADGSIDLTVTSPPYDNLRTYNDTLDWGEHVWKPVLQELFRVTKHGGVVVWVVNDATIKGSETGTSFRQALYAKEIGFNLHDTMIYHKQNAMPLTHNRYDPCFEYMFVFSVGRPKTFNPILEDTLCSGQVKKRELEKKMIGVEGHQSRNREEHTVVKNKKFKKNLWTYTVGTEKERSVNKHPAIFPEKLANDHVISWSNVGDTVFDPFLGSGTTGKMALACSRNFIGIERDDKYFDISVKRIRGEL
jgi:site-specific DNA-methyltransferase (adenine-specific)